MGAAVWGRSDALLVFRGPTSRTGAVIAGVNAGLYEGQWRQLTARSIGMVDDDVMLNVTACVERRSIRRPK